MKRINILAVSILFAAVFAVSTSAQVPAATKIGWIDTGAFGDDKEGVTKYINALKALDAEFKPRATELQGIQTRLTQINDDLKKMQANPAIPVDQKAFAAKQDEGQKLQRDGEYKQKDFEAAYNRRSAEVLGPITNDILKAVQDYAKAKGYAVVLDIAALANQNLNAILVLDPSANITKDFVAYYNTRPATTATTATPK